MYGVAFAQTQTPHARDFVQLSDYIRQETVATRFKQQKEIPVYNFNPNVINTNIIKNSPNLNFLQANDIVYKEVSTQINAINPSKANGNNSYYPGLRGPNQLIVYTPEYGLRTGTNEFGTEAIVVNGTVVRLNGADSIIPDNGFVISGHGKAKKWITENIQVGSNVTIDYLYNNLVVQLTPDSLIFAAKERIREVNALVEYYRNQDILYDDKKPSEYLIKAKEQLKKGEKDKAKTQQYVHSSMTYLNDAIKYAIPYKADEFKGVWLRPVEASEEAIIKTVEKLNQAGIDNIFLETYYHGMTIYPSTVLKEYNVISQRPEFVGFDPLAVWINECHKRGMKLHIWFETFYAGQNNTRGTIVNTYPQWSNKRKSNYDSTSPVVSLSENNGYFLDPANEAVREFLYRLIDEIITVYRPDGINLDYIRYPQTVEPKFGGYESSNWGYTEAARTEFINYTNTDPINISYGTQDWKTWSKYRQNKISTFVETVHKKTKPQNILLSAVVFPDLNKAVSTKMQNWKVWVNNGLVDAVTPLILTSDKNTAEMLLKNVRMTVNNDTALYSGLFVTFMGGSVDDLLIQIQKSREVGANGIILFDYAHFSQKYMDALSTRVFNKNSDETAKKQHSVYTYTKPEVSNNAVYYNDAKKKSKFKKTRKR
ncbi:family 10 glycosylhydrolase [bacterium]|nr:family 10 glycosylhydrolase [bacterium]